MLFIRTDDLKPGMRLAKPIYNKLGVMLYDRDTRLTQQVIESIRNFELIGIYILEPAEPVPPLSDEDIAFEQFQTISMFQLRDCMDMIRKGRQPDKLPTLVSSILSQYGRLDHKLNFAQNLRSSADYVYKHSISVAILVAMLTHQLNMPDDFQQTCVTAALLYDFGWLLVPTELAEKTDPLTEEDEKKILACRIKSLDYLNPQTHSIKLSPDVLRIITQFITLSAPEEAADPSKIFRSSGTKLLQVADAFDRMTAMSLTNEPISEIVAMKYLQEFPEKYDTKIVRALSLCIHILPRGACVDLSNGEKAMILEDNPEDYSKPLILQFTNNEIFDLRDPHIHDIIQIQDIMKTMDNRIAIDENTLKHFTSDKYIKAVADRFRKRQNQAAATAAAEPAPKKKAARKKLV